MGGLENQISAPRLWLIGPFDHPDFRDAVGLIGSSSQFHAMAGICQAATELRKTSVAPGLIVVAHCRPGAFRSHDLERLRRAAPLAGIVSLLGSWCEGESRTGRPWPGAVRLYWYEFPAWWQRQLALHSAGHCPDWARFENCGLGNSVIRNPQSAIRNPTAASRGVILLNVLCRDTADALADLLQTAGYAAVWQPPGRRGLAVRGAVAGIWEGGQLSDSETDDLATFCRSVACGAAPVVALLDFPRCDRVQLVLSVGAHAVLGKPWLNADLITTIDAVTHKGHSARAA